MFEQLSMFDTKREQIQTVVSVEGFVPCIRCGNYPTVRRLYRPEVGWDFPIAQCPACTYAVGGQLYVDRGISIQDTWANSQERRLHRRKFSGRWEWVLSNEQIKMQENPYEKERQ